MSSIVNTYSPVIHGRAPLLWVVLPGMAGVQLGTQEVVYPWLWLALAGVALAGLWSKAEGRGFHMILVLFGLVLGMLYTSLRLGSTYHTGTEHPPREVEWQIELVEVGLALDNYGRHVGLGRVVRSCANLPEWEGKKVQLAVGQAQIDRINWRKGTRLQIRAVWHGIPSKHYRNHWEQRQKRNGISARLSHVQVQKIDTGSQVFELVMRAHDGVLKTLLGPTPELREARILAAMVLGQRSLLESEDRERFLLSGTMHLFAISGLHVGIVASLVYGLLTILRIQGWPHFLCGMWWVGFYVQITGSPASAVRAWIMISLFWLAKSVLRQNSPLATLSVAALIVIIWQPQQILELGFQLSYIVVAALILYAVPLINACQRSLPLNDLSGHIRDSFLISMTAFLVSSPLIYTYFGVYSPGGVLINIVLVLLALLAVSAAMLATLVSLTGLAGAELLFQRAGCMCIHLMLHIIDAGLKIPGMYMRASDTTVIHGLVASIAIVAAMAWGRELFRQGVGWRSWIPAPAAHLLWLVLIKLQ